jgi:hypothetical protein
LCSRSLVCVALTLSAAPALAQIDLSGTWTLQNQQDYQDSHFGNFPTDFLGIPINEDARAAGLGGRGISWRSCSGSASLGPSTT